MEYLKVTTKSNKRVAVIVNGEKNGFTDDVLTLEEGFVEISVDIPKTTTREIELKNTTPRKPMTIKFNI